MARVELAPEIREDFDRIIDHLLAHEVDNPVSRIEVIIAALDVLASSPLLGRPRDDQLRELIIGRGSSGFVALYQYVEEMDVVFVLAIKSQREAGYVRGADEPD